MAGVVLVFARLILVLLGGDRCGGGGVLVCVVGAGVRSSCG